MARRKSTKRNYFKTLARVYIFPVVLITSLGGSGIDAFEASDDAPFLIQIFSYLFMIFLSTLMYGGVIYVVFLQK